ncbi:MAG TPA: DNA starvation/stationary phase protection protein [Virgibacillus sp.]|nr:DNA starvation/stationary phase protection protein [Virgibacillus sp.]
MKNQKLVDHLNQLLSNYFVMYVKLHRYHWYIQGRNFFQLHELFEKMYTEFALDYDALAERILMINGKPFATMVKFLKETTLTEANADDTESEIIAQLIKDYEQIIEEISNEGMSYAAELEDEPTMDILTGFQSKLEKHVWMLSAYHTN